MLLYLGLGLLGGCGQETGIREVPFDLGRAPMRRINGDEFDRTLTGLLGTDTSPSKWLPVDEEAYDFHTIAEAQFVGPLHIEGYETAAGEALGSFFGPIEKTYAIEAEGNWVSRSGGTAAEPGFWVLTGAMSTSIDLPHPGTHDVAIVAYAHTGVGADVSVYVDSDRVDTFTVASRSADNPQTFSVAIRLDAGAHTIRLTQEQGLAAIDRIEVTGPVDAEFTPSSAYTQVVFCHPDEAGPRCVDDILGAFLRRAWRRPPDGEALAWARQLYDVGYTQNLASFEDGLRTAFLGILMAPDFIFREEASPEPGGEPVVLDDFQIASRLSHFLWSTGPDEALLVAAEAGELNNSEVLRAQVDRMLADPRSEALVHTFAAQWFDVDLLDAFSPDPVTYRMFSDDLRQSIIEEVHGLSDRFISGEIDLYGLLTTQEAVLDRRMANHYRVPYTGEGWISVPIDQTGRAGVLGTSGWLMAHSHAAAPSAVRRGKWVLGRMLCDEPPPPPPDIDQELVLDASIGTVREQEERQRAGEPCHTCHKVMDPIGFAMGGFSTTGEERRYDELGLTIDTNVQIDGRSIDRIDQLAAWVATDARLPACVVEQVFLFALGRPPVEADEANISAITQEFLDGGADFPALAKALVSHPVFVHRADILEEDAP